ncbi:MAG: hypothetical protein CMJ54_05605 [Planctomycetaceae bacterium]|nr:hypothetical protein [Planctomycetaceae bacterium]
MNSRFLKSGRISLLDEYRANQSPCRDQSRSHARFFGRSDRGGPTSSDPRFAPEGKRGAPAMAAMDERLLHP